MLILNGGKDREKKNKKKKQALALPIDSMTILSISAFASVFISVVESRVWQRVVVD